MAHMIIGYHNCAGNTGGLYGRYLTPSYHHYSQVLIE